MVVAVNIISELENKFGKNNISKSRLTMAVHYYLRDCISGGHSNYDVINSKIEELIENGILIERNGQYKIA